MIKRVDNTVQLIPIDKITVVNGRERGRTKFKQIVTSIERLGLKKPATVALRRSKDGSVRYDLVYGQGRLEACQILGETHLPAVVVEASEEDTFLMSLVENMARRRHITLELAREIGALKERGYDYGEIARKTDLTESYVRGIVKLIKKGESQLLTAVEKGQIPISIAVTIASSDNESVREALSEAYNSKGLRGKALIRARQIIEKILRQRRQREDESKGDSPTKLPPGKLMKAYERELGHQQSVIRKANLCDARLLFIVSALKSLLKDEHFVNLLKVEKLDTLPQFLANELKNGSKHHG